MTTQRMTWVGANGNMKSTVTITEKKPAPDKGYTKVVLNPGDSIDMTPELAASMDPRTLACFLPAKEAAPLIESKKVEVQTQDLRAKLEHETGKAIKARARAKGNAA